MPELNVGATVQEIKASYEREKTQCVLDSFEIVGKAAREATSSVSEGAKSRMSQQNLEATYMAEAYNLANGIRDELKTPYELLDAEMRAAINARAAIIEAELLAPKEFNPSDLIAACQMNEGAMLSAVEISDDLDEAGEDTLLLLFKRLGKMI